MTLAHDYHLGAARMRVRAADYWQRSRRAAHPLQWLLEQRVVQFALIGGLIFAVAPRPRSSSTIEITGKRLSALRAAEAANSRELHLSSAMDRAVDQRALEDEILYREGIRLGLDKNDGIVRQRIAQKVLFLAEEVAGASRPPDPASLQAF